LNNPIGSDNWTFLLAATNRPQDLDSAALRRFQRRILVDIPGQTDRKSILSLNLKGIKHSISSKDFIAIAKALDGYSSSDITNLCKQAVYAPINRASKHPNWLTMSPDDLPPVTKADFMSSIKDNHPSCSSKEIKSLRKWK